MLVIEDDRAQLHTLTAGLEARGYHVLGVESGADALEAIDHERVDAILLDLGLPDADGLAVCRRLRVWTRCPIVVVTADADEERVIEALDVGADDYVVKPYRMPVLMARVRVALRHASISAAGAEPTSLEVGDICLDLTAQQVIIDDTRIEMSHQQFAMLAMLARNAGKIVTYEVLARALWGYEPTEHDYNSLRIGISRVRQQLGTGPRRPEIRNERRVGYRLTTPDD